MLIIEPSARRHIVGSRGPWPQPRERPLPTAQGPRGRAGSPPAPPWGESTFPLALGGDGGMWGIASALAVGMCGCPIRGGPT